MKPGKIRRRLEKASQNGFFVLLLLLFFVLLIESSSEAYQILGGLENSNESNNSDRQERQRIFQVPLVNYLGNDGVVLEMEETLYEEDGSVSMAGTAWEASRVLAHYITSPSVRDRFQNKIILELGSGIGICALAAAFLKTECVIATDGSDTSLELLERNVERNHATDKVMVQKLSWGSNLGIMNEEDFPDVILASDVVYHHSDRTGLYDTIQQLAGPSTTIMIGHCWRVDPDVDQAYFDSWKERFDCRHADASLLPSEYQRRGMDGRYPVAIMEFSRRKQT